MEFCKWIWGVVSFIWFNVEKEYYDVVCFEGCNFVLKSGVVEGGVFGKVVVGEY